MPKGKKMVDTTVGVDVDSLFKSVFENDNFFEIVGSKAYEEFRLGERNTNDNKFYELEKNVENAPAEISIAPNGLREGTVSERGR